MLSQGTISSGGASRTASRYPVSSAHGDIQGCEAAHKRELEEMKDLQERVNTPSGFRNPGGPWKF